MMLENERGDTSVLTTLFRHNAWANLKLLDFCEGLNDAQLDATAIGCFGTIRDTLQHIVGAEVSYVERVNGKLPPKPLAAGQVPGFELLKDAARWASDELLQLALSAREDTSVRERDARWLVEYKLASLMVQAITHSTEHRTQISAIITQLGIEPPDMSGWKYMEEIGEFQEVELQEDLEMGDRASQELTYYGDNQTARGYLAMPERGEGPGVLVLHAWWGLNDTMRAVCTRLAEAGFVAFAPDLYHGKVADTIADAETLGKALDTNHLQAKAEIADATRFLSERAGRADRDLAVIGFSLGAYYALDLAAADPEHIRSVVIFYGTGGGDFNNSRAAYLGHFAENDEFEPQSNVDELEESLRRAGRPVTFYHYSGTGHWFFEPDRSQAYNQAAASLAWDRTLAFLRRPSTV